MALISNEDLTQASGVTTSADDKYTVTGSGVFDNLMEAVNAHLEAQFNLGRLKGTDYANVYLGAIQSSMQTSVQFVLGKQQSDKQADLLIAQTSQVAAQTISGIQTSDADLTLKRQQIISESFSNGMEVNEYIWEVTYTGDVGNTYTYTTNENLTEGDILALMTADPHIAGKTVNTVILNQVNNIQHAGKSTAETMIAKTQEEVDLLRQKRVTEYAQTQITSTDGSEVISNHSIIGRQSTLYEKQAAGFEWDAKNSYNKNIADIIKIQINTLGTFNNQEFVSVNDLIEPFANEPPFSPNSQIQGETQ